MMMYGVITLLFCIFLKVNSLPTLFEVDCSDGLPNYHKYPNDCQKYYGCSEDKVVVLYTCKDGFYWNDEIKACDIDHNLICRPTTVRPSTPTTKRSTSATSTSTTSTSSSSTSTTSTSTTSTSTTPTSTTSTSTKSTSTTSTSTTSTLKTSTTPTTRLSTTPSRPPTTPSTPPTTPSTPPTTQSTPPSTTPSRPPTTPSRPPTTLSSPTTPSRPPTTQSTPPTKTPTRPPTTPTTSSSRTTTQSPIPTPPVCSWKTEYYRYPYNCSKYYECKDYDLSLKDCNATMLWNDELKQCDHTWNVDCSYTVPYPSSPTTASPMVCSATNKVFEYLYDCSKYYKCVNGTPVLEDCPEAMSWDRIKQICNFSGAVDCSYIIH